MGKVIKFSEISNKRVRKVSKSEAENMFQLMKLISYFCNNSSQKLYKTKLHKLLFYTQFLYYKKYGRQLLDGDFICDYYGPVFEELDEYLNEFEELNFITIGTTPYGTTIDKSITISNKEYTPDERNILKKVLKKFNSFTSREISDYSHEEALWIYTNIKTPIDIRRANELNDF